jgi:hypothetical protein
MFFMLLQATADARSVLITWDDNSEDEEGFFVERTLFADCFGGWEVIAYTGINQNHFEDIYIPGACYRVAAYNRLAASTYSNIARVALK